MKNIFPLLLSFCVSVASIAQKKMMPVTQSTLTGISLPAGSKQDNRMLSVAGAKMLLEMESKKTNITLSSPEVLLLPSVTASTFNADSLVKNLSDQGWTVSVSEGDKKYAWLQKDSRHLIMYFSMDANETGLYFAEAATAPAQNGQGNNTGTIQTTTTENNQIQQTTDTTVQTNPPEIVQQPTQPATNSGFAFTSTNFDDGWTSTVQEDWVEVTKGNIKVLLHYPKEGTIFPADPEPLTNAAWNILVTPRYKNLTTYKTAYITTYKRPYLGMGYAIEKATGKNVFIVLFYQYQVWIEIITPDKNTFIQQYKFDPETIHWDSNSDLMIPLANMAVYNKFAIAASDFKGKWTSDFTGIQQMYNVYTGQYAGMNMNQSNEEFIFKDASTYSWKLLVVNGMVGNAKFNEVKSSGKLTVPNNWQIKFSMIENRARTYHAFWSCIKSARILNLLDADYPGSGIYTKYGLAK